MIYEDVFENKLWKSEQNVKDLEIQGYPYSCVFVSATERRAEKASPDAGKNVGQNKLLSPCVEEPGSKKEPEQESPQTYENKCSLKARHIKSTRKG